MPLPHSQDLQTKAITLTLLFRTVGAVFFGVFSDRFGRKWPLVFNLLLVSVLELGAGFVQTFRQFLVLRSLFGARSICRVAVFENLIDCWS
jgi:MFS family permease